MEHRPTAPGIRAHRAPRTALAATLATGAALTSWAFAGGSLASATPAGHVATPARHVAIPAKAHKVTKAKSVAFTGHYTGKAAMLIDNGSVTISSVTGRGSGSLVGASTVTGSGSASAAAQCDPFSGTGSITGHGATIKFTVASSSSQGCSSGESGPVTVSFHGTARATGGTGKAAGAKGSLSFKGTLHLGGTSGSQTGSYTVSLTGKLTVK